MAFRFDRRRPSYKAEDVKSILLLNTTAIGDTLFCTPAIRALRRAFRGAKITSFVSPAAKEVLWNNPHIDRLVDCPGRVNLPFFLKLPWILRNLRKDKFDLSIVLDSNDMEAGPFSYLSGAPVRIGWRESKFAFLFTILMPKRTGGLHVVDRRLKTLEVIGVKSDGGTPEVFLTGEEINRADTVIREAGLSGETLAGIHPFGARRNRWWPEEYAVSLCNQLSGKYGLRLIIFGGKKEMPFAQRIAERTKGRALAAAGRFKIRESAALMKKCDFLVSPDSGPLHLAQAVGTPVIALFGPADPAVTGPSGEKKIVLRKETDCSPCNVYDCAHVSCMKAIAVEDVIAALEEMKARGWVKANISVTKS